jgi:dihydroflavonol-4-reductase
MTATADMLTRLGLTVELSGPTVAGGFLRLHVTGERADRCFGLVHPPAVESIRSSLDPTGGGRRRL